MKSTTTSILQELGERYPALSPLTPDIEAAFTLLQTTASTGGTLFTCGNGGSASDSEHIVGELMKSFKKRRPIDETVAKKLEAYGEDGKKLLPVLEGAIKAVALTSHPSLSTAFSNDKSPVAVFAQQVYGLGEEGDTLLCLSTSGNSANCVLAAIVAKAKGMRVIAMTGEKQSKLSELADVTLRVLERETYKIQELHLPLYHCLCAMLEEENF